MVAECEWGNLGEIVYDFEKLLLAKAAVKVMVYGWKDTKCVNNKLLKHVRTFNGARGDTYLLIAFVWDESSDANRVEFAQIIDQGPGKPPTLQTL